MLRPLQFAIALCLATASFVAAQEVVWRALSNWATMPGGRTWGSTSTLDVDRAGNVWVFERCGANSCAASNLPPVLQFDTAGAFVRSFVTVGDVFAGLLVPVIESAADALVQGELPRVHRCANPRCNRVFFDASRNGKRRWCEMATCGNRAKAARHRQKVRQLTA